MKTSILALGFLLTMTVPAAAQNVDITGTWNLTIVTPEGGQPAPLVLRMDGAKIVGTISGHQGQALVEASVQGKAVTIAFTVPRPNGDIAVVLTGTADGDASGVAQISGVAQTMQGAVDFGGRAQGAWSGTRAAAVTPTPAPGAGQADAKVDVTGTWIFEVNTAAGTGTPTVTLKQDGEKLTGHYAGSYGEASLTGTVKGTAIEFALDLDAQGTVVHIVYSGVVDTDTVKGAVTLGDFGDGTFTGKRK